MKTIIIILLWGILKATIAYSQGTPPLPPMGNNNFTIRVFLEGFYTGDSEMRQAHEFIDPAVIPRWISPISEKITVEIHEQGYYGVPGHIFAVPNVNLTQDGYAMVGLPSTGTYYLTIRTRNHLETVSSQAINLATTSSWDFTTAASQAYGNNMVDLGAGVFGIYAGDVNQDGFIDINDAGPIDVDIILYTKGYVTNEINGDGYVDINDIGVVSTNITNGVSKATP